MDDIKSKSSLKAIFLNGKIEHLINPWYFELNFNEENIKIRKRNWYYIGWQTEIISFRFIRKIITKEHLFGGDIYIKAFNNKTSANYLPKKDLKNIREAIIKYNTSKSKNIIIA